MRRTLTAVTSQLLSVVFCFLPAFGQQLFTPSRASVHRFGRLAGRTTEASSTGEPIPAIATPVWTPFSQLTNHTGLDGPSAVGGAPRLRPGTSPHALQIPSHGGHLALLQGLCRFHMPAC